MFARWLTEINSFSFKSYLLREIYKHFVISVGSRTSKSDLQKITEMVVECSCVVKRLSEKTQEEGKNQFIPFLLLLIFLPRTLFKFTALL